MKKIQDLTSTPSQLFEEVLSKMNRIGFIFSLYCAFLIAIPAVASAQSSKVHWQDAGPGLWTAIGENWGPIRFSAVKFHLGYYKLNLVDARSYRNKNIQKIRAINDNSKFSNELLDSGIETIFKLSLIHIS